MMWDICRIEVSFKDITVFRPCMNSIRLLLKSSTEKKGRTIFALFLSCSLPENFLRRGILLSADKLTQKNEFPLEIGVFESGKCPRGRFNLYSTRHLRNEWQRSRRWPHLLHRVLLPINISFCFQKRKRR